MKNLNNYLQPDWPAPSGIKAYTTTRVNGHSQAPYNSFNLAAHVEDDPATVAENRLQLVNELELPQEPIWIKQVHGIKAVSLNSDHGLEPTADASFTHTPNQVCAVLTADCLPVLLCNKNGGKVAAIHAGWRGLLAGVIDSTIKAMATPANQLIAWLGPAIGQQAFEVNEDIRDSYIKRDSNNRGAFSQHKQQLLGDIYHLARNNLAQCGINQVYGGDFCTYQDAKRFYSYRREQGLTGRIATLIYFTSP